MTKFKKSNLRKPDGNRKADSPQMSENPKSKKAWKDMTAQERALSNLEIRSPRARPAAGLTLPLTKDCEERNWYHDRMSMDERLRRLIERYRKYNDIVKSSDRKFPVSLIDELESLEYDPPDDVVKLALSDRYRGFDSLGDIETERNRITIPTNILNMCDWRDHLFHQSWDDNDEPYYTMAEVREDDPARPQNDDDDNPAPESVSDSQADNEQDDNDEDEGRQVPGFDYRAYTDGTRVGETDDFVETFFEPARGVVLYEETSVRQDSEGDQEEGEVNYEPFFTSTSST